MSGTTDLSEKMLARANTDGLPATHPLWVLAREFEIVAAGFFADPQTCTAPKFFKAWIQARKAWCAYSGEALI